MFGYYTGECFERDNLWSAQECVVVSSSPWRETGEVVKVQACWDVNEESFKEKQWSQKLKHYGGDV